MEPNCTNCKNAIFCEAWGEYKCTLFEKRIYNAGDKTPCQHYKTGNPLSKECHCEDCMNEIKEEN